jgi:protein gp37
MALIPTKPTQPAQTEQSSVPAQTEQSSVPAQTEQSSVPAQTEQSSVPAPQKELAPSPELLAYEEIIADGLDAFYKVGEALLAVRDSHRYQERGYATFEDYCRGHWQMARSTAYQMIDGAKVYENVRHGGQILPETERQVRPLTRLKDPALQKAAWQDAQERAAASGTKVTGAVVQAAVDEIKAQQAEHQEHQEELALIAPPADEASLRSGKITLPVLPPKSERGLYLPTPAEVDALRDASQATFNKQQTDNIEWARWSWNPVTGCLHSCPYCVSPDTLILMADGSVRPIKDVRVGDRIIGTQKQDSYRKYVETTVLAHWQTFKPAFRVTLANGTTIVTSGDHRFLTDRHEWKYVTGLPASDRRGVRRGAGQRPYLTTNNSLMGIGTATLTQPETSDYRRGYIAGVVRGDGHLKQHRDKRGQNRFVYQFRLAMKDEQSTHRVAEYLRTFGIEPSWFDFNMGAYQVRAIRTSQKEAFYAIRSLVAEMDSPEFRRGFLAGLIDAEGHGNTSYLRIFNSDLQILAVAERALTENGFTFIYDRDNKGTNKPVYILRLVGGLREVLRLFQWSDPTVRRKLKMVGSAVKTDANLQVVSIEPLGIVVPMVDMTTGTEDFIANGVIAHNCYARDIAARFYEQGFEPTFLPERLAAPRNTKPVDLAPGTNPVDAMGWRNVFVCSMADLWGKWVPSPIIRYVLREAHEQSQWTYLYLTKFPQRYEEFAHELPANTWVGTSVDNQNAVARAEKAFKKLVAAGHQGVRWLSCEPLLEPLTFTSLEMFDWVIIGGSSRSTQTPEFQPPLEWIWDLYCQARKAGCGVYMKTNLFGNVNRVREYPAAK